MAGDTAFRQVVPTHNMFLLVPPLPSPFADSFFVVFIISSPEIRPEKTFHATQTLKWPGKGHMVHTVP